MNRAIRFAKIALIIWGGLSLLAVLVIGSLIVFQFSVGNTDDSRPASFKDVRFVLNWCDLGDDRIREVTHSFQSARSFTGDHLDGHAIRVSHLEVDELVSTNSRGWLRCDELEGVSKMAIDYVTMWLGSGEMEWFPGAERLKTSEFFVYIWSLDLSGTSPDAVQLILAQPSENMVYYVSAAH